MANDSAGDFTVQVHRHAGPDEDLVFETEEEARNVLDEALGESDVRRVVLLDPADRVLCEVAR